MLYLCIAVVLIQIHCNATYWLVVERVRSSRHNAGLLRLLLSSVSSKVFFFGTADFGVGVENADSSFRIDNTANSVTVVLMTSLDSVLVQEPYGTRYRIFDQLVA